jgi:hypothetical protein
MNLTDCYAHFGITLNNPRRWAWSKQAEDGTVVVTLWSTLFKDVDRINYDTFDMHEQDREWMERHENRHRIEHLRYARDQRAGIFQSIIVTPGDSRRTEVSNAEIGPRMRLIELNEDTGEFRAQRARI